MIMINCGAIRSWPCCAGSKMWRGRGGGGDRDGGGGGGGRGLLIGWEWTPADADEQARYKKIVMDEKAVDELLVNLYIQSQARAPEQIVLDLDATDDPVHGNQEGRFFHGYYGADCYLPLAILMGEALVCARLRSSNIDASAGAMEEVARIVEQLRRGGARGGGIFRGAFGCV